MEDTKTYRRYLELSRNLNRIENLYEGIIINTAGEDSFESPKDLILNFFRCSYELKENIKNDFPSLKKIIEREIDTSKRINISIDMANQEKHGKLKTQRSDKKIGKINIHIHMFDPTGKKDRTEGSIEIDDKKIDILILLQNIEKERKNIVQKYVIKK